MMTVRTTDVLVMFCASYEGITFHFWFSFVLQKPQYRLGLKSFVFEFS